MVMTNIMATSMLVPDAGDEMCLWILKYWRRFWPFRSPTSSMNQRWEPPFKRCHQDLKYNQHWRDSTFIPRFCNILKFWKTFLRIKILISLGIKVESRHSKIVTNCKSPTSQCHQYDCRCTWLNENLQN